MACTHQRIKSVNCEIFCMECGEKLPIDYLVGKERIAEQKKAEETAEPETKEAPKTTKKTTKKGAK